MICSKCSLSLPDNVVAVMTINQYPLICLYFLLSCVCHIEMVTMWNTHINYLPSLKVELTEACLNAIVCHSLIVVVSGCQHLCGLTVAGQCPFLKQRFVFWVVSCLLSSCLPIACFSIEL